MTKIIAGVIVLLLFAAFDWALVAAGKRAEEEDENSN